jgi:glutaredoxin
MLTIYSKPNCPYCQLTKAFLNRKNISFEEIDITANADAKSLLVTAGHKTVPQIYLNGELFVSGGYTGLSSMKEEELTEKLNKR